MPPSDHELARLARRQHGVVTRDQFLSAGLGIRAISHRLKVGRLHRLHRGVYAVGHVPPSPQARAMAAVLACGPEAVLSHRSAATLWGIDSRWRRPIEVTVPGDRRQPGVWVHRSQTLEPHDVTVHFGIPVTAPARTLLDLADVLDDRAIARAVNDARIHSRLRLADLAALLARSPGRRGTARLRPFLDAPSGPTRSVFEDAFLTFAERHRLPRPEVNETIAGYEVDMLWRAQQLIVELDSRLHHADGQAFERDRAKDADLLAAGYAVIRVTWTRLVHEPKREADRLRNLLGRESA